LNLTLKIKMKSIAKIVIVASVIVVIILIVILVWQVTKSDEAGGGGEVIPTDVDISPVLFGIVPSTNTAVGGIIPLSTVIDTIDIFWDWQPFYDASLYGVAEGDEIYKKFVPMQWSLADTMDTRLVAYLQKAQSPFVMMYNEPDLAGSIIGMVDNAAVATGDGFWIDATNFSFGNAIENGITSVEEAKSGATSFIDIATKLFDNSTQCKNIVSNINVTTPAMALSADISRGCSGYKPMTAGLTGGCNISQDNNNLVTTAVRTGMAEAVNITLCGTCGWPHNPSEVAPECKSLPSAGQELNGEQAYVDGGICKTDGCSGPQGGCGCNGWLTLAKELAPVESNWWNTVDIINFHSYEKYAHRTKLKILEYMYVYKEDIVKRDAKGIILKAGKELWLTEVAALYSTSDLVNNSWQDIQAHFLAELLWGETSNPEDITNCSSYEKYGVPAILPGLRSTVKFEYLGTNGSFYEHGFGAITWFLALQFPGFPSDCETEKTADFLNSSIWNNDGKLNQIFDVLCGKQKSIQLKQ
jgi:hypothetical protein